MSMVIDRLSSDAISAVMIAQTESKSRGLSELTEEFLAAGVCSEPERAGRTLERYGITASGLIKSAERILDAPSVGEASATGKITEGENPLPFSEGAKAVLDRVTVIADRFASPRVRSEHVLLALLGYNYDSAATDASQCRGLAVIKDALIDEEAKAKFDAFEFCDALLDDLMDQPEPKDDDDDAASGAPGGSGAPGRDVVVTRTEVVTTGAPAPGSTPTLDAVGVDLTRMAYDGKLDAVYGREDEIRQALRTLGRRRKNNPCLIGEPGVGKTSIAEGLAQVLASGFGGKEGNDYAKNEEEEFKRKFLGIKNPFQKKEEEEEEKAAADYRDQGEGAAQPPTLPPCPLNLKGYRLVSVDLASLVAGTRNRGDFEERIQKIVSEARSTRTILFVDEVHTLIGAGGGDGASNAANLLKPALARGELRLLGATTTAEYRRYIEKDGALERRFQPLTVEEPTVEQAESILGAIVPKYEEYHGVKYTPLALEAAAKLSDRYINDRYLPDKAIDLLDESGSMIRMMDDGTDDADIFVTDDTIAQVVSEISGVPVGRLDTGEKARLRTLEKEMEKRVIGQDRAVRSVAKSVRRARSGLRDGRRPVASFLFCGPTGVGKTELCKSLADTYFGREKDMIRIDMSEYMERHTTSRLVGSPPGYVGYDEGGQLTEAVRRKPHSVVLLDELEKAHPDVLNILLQVLDEGTLTDGKGRTVSFKNTILVMTSNVGSDRILDLARNGAGGGTTASVLDMAEVVKDELTKSMKPELLNRIDEIVIFSPLAYEDLRDIASNLVEATAERASSEGNIELIVTDELLEKILDDGVLSSPEFGARPMRRTVQRFVEDTVAEGVMREFVQEGDEVTVDVASPAEASGFAGGRADRVVAKITRSANGMQESMLVPVEDDAGIGSIKDDEDDLLNRAMPPLPENSFE